MGRRRRAEYPYTFGWQPDYEIEGKIIGQYVAENMPDAKVGLFLQDDDFGEDGEKGVRQYLDDQIVDVERYTSGNTDVAPQIAGLQAAGADLVLGFNTPSYTALTPAGLAEARLQAAVVLQQRRLRPDARRLAARRASPRARSRATPSSLDGVMTTEYIPGVDAPTTRGSQLWQKVWDAGGRASGDLTNYRIYGMSQAYAFVQALQAAGEDLTRDGLVEALEEAGGAFEGPQLAPFRYSADSHLGISGMQIVELKGGSAEPLTPVLVTDIGDAEIDRGRLRPGRRRPAGERHPGREVRGPRSTPRTWVGTVHLTTVPTHVRGEAGPASSSRPPEGTPMSSLSLAVLLAESAERNPAWHRGHRG